MILIKFAKKQQARYFLRKNFTSRQKCSSLYKLDNFYYLLIVVADKSELVHKDVFTINNVTVLDKDYLSLPEQALFAWAKSEVEQSLLFIQYENNSKLVLLPNFPTSGRVLILSNGIEITKSFEYLAETVAILNYTKDSFSDGGEYDQIDKACERIIKQVKLGASIIDLGLESTRPGALPINGNDEINLLKQILPLIIELKHEINFTLSIDTYHSETVYWLLNLGDIDIINDVSGNLPVDLVANVIKANKRYIAMHNLGIPASKDKVLDLNLDPIEVIATFVNKKVTEFLDCGINIKDINEAVIFDPGIGFGNNPSQAWYILNNLTKLNTHSCELLIGHSRKSLLSHITNKTGANRDLATAIVAAKIIDKVDYVRLHEIELLNEIYCLDRQFT